MPPRKKGANVALHRGEIEGRSADIISLNPGGDELQALFGEDDEGSDVDVIPSMNDNATSSLAEGDNIEADTRCFALSTAEACKTRKRRQVGFEDILEGTEGGVDPPIGECAGNEILTPIINPKRKKLNTKATATVASAEAAISQAFLKPKVTTKVVKQPIANAYAFGQVGGNRQGYVPMDAYGGRAPVDGKSKGVFGDRYYIEVHS
jgi:hypothetical protein